MTRLERLTLRLVDDAPWRVLTLQPTLNVSTQLRNLDCRGFLLTDDMLWLTVLEKLPHLQSLKASIANKTKVVAIYNVIRTKYPHLEAKLTVWVRV